MQIEVGTPVLLEFGASQDRIKAVYVGSVRDQYALFSVPLTTGIKSKAREGNRVTVRYLHHGTIFGFQSEVVDFRTKPSTILFMHHPSRIEQKEIRGARRVGCNFPCRIYSHSREVDGLIVDISEGGCRLAFGTKCGKGLSRLEAGARIRAEFYIMEEKNRYCLDATLLHRHTENGRCTLGLRFDDDIAVRRVISNYVETVSSMLA